MLADTADHTGLQYSSIGRTYVINAVIKLRTSLHKKTSPYLAASNQRCYQDQGVRDQDQTKTREAETKTKTKTKTSKSDLDRSRDQDQVSRYVRNVVV